MKLARFPVACTVDRPGHRAFQHRAVLGAVKVLRFAPTTLTRGLRTLTAPARSSEHAITAMAGHEIGLLLAMVEIDDDLARRYPAFISPVLTPAPPFATHTVHAERVHGPALRVRPDATRSFGSTFVHIT